MKHFSIYLTVILALLLGACRNDKDSPVPDGPVIETTTLNVDVILPKDILAQWQPSIDWAMSNISSAQQQLSRRVHLNLRYHDEDAEDLDALAYRLTHPEEGDDTCHAVIGPYHSVNAPDVLRYAGRNRLPVLMPCTSSELQRSNARNTYAWFLTESDITQCEIMVSGAARLNATDVALIYSDDTYGQSFRDWFGYYATERQVRMAGEGIAAYTRGTDLTAFLDGVGSDRQGKWLVMCIALSDVADYPVVTEQVRQWTSDYNDNVGSILVDVILSDTALDDEVLQSDGLWFRYGICPIASPNYGYSQSYEARFGKPLQNGAAQGYDALMMIALGAAHQMANGENCYVAGRQVVYYDKPYGPTLTDHIRSVVASEEGLTCGWDVTDMARAFSEVAAGRDITLTGATGSLTFDTETYTKVLGTNYMLWQLNIDEKGRTAKPVFHISTEGTSTQASTTSLWQLDKSWSETFTDVSVDHNLPDVTDRWGVVISPSTSWSNYRHQADAFAMYQTLRHHGYDDDHIVLIVEDNLADDVRNVFPGEIFVERSDDPGYDGDIFMNDDVRKNAVVDYHFSDLRPEDIADILLGRRSERLPEVIHPTATSDVFFFWSGHGGNREGPLWGNEDAQQYFGTDRIRNIVTEMAGLAGTGDGATESSRLYRRMMFAIETCYSGKWGEALTGLPDVLVLTAANARESSKADVHDRDLGVYLSNAFARTFRRQVNDNPAITIYDLYRELFKTTQGSHVSIYNQTQYGSVYDESISEFLPE